MRYTPKTHYLLLCLLLLASTAGCFGGDSDSASAVETAESAVNTFEQFGEAMAEMSEQMEATRAVEPVDFRKLRALLPEALPGGIERTDWKGSSGGTMGINVSHVEATYQGANDEHLTIKITDAGAMPGVSMLGLGWTIAEIDRESSSGYERTLTYRGHQAHEKYNSDRRHGTMSALVADRFIVEVEGRKIEMQAVKDAMAEIDFGALEAMKTAGVKAGN